MRQTAMPPKSLLIVDDDRRLAQLLAWSFEDLGYAAWTAGSVAEALEVLANLRFDFALLDLGLPDGSGAALGMRLLDDQPQARIAMMSADRAAVDQATRDIVDQSRGRNASRIGGLGKPVRPGRLHRWYRDNTAPATTLVADR